MAMLGFSLNPAAGRDLLQTPDPKRFALVVVRN